LGRIEVRNLARPGFHLRQLHVHVFLRICDPFSIACRTQIINDVDPADKADWPQTT
jgi:hypothetical protein